MSAALDSLLKSFDTPTPAPPRPLSIDGVPALYKLLEKKRAKALVASPDSPLRLSTPLPRKSHARDETAVAENTDQEDIVVSGGLIQFATLEKIVERVTTDDTAVAQIGLRHIFYSNLFNFLFSCFP